MCLHAAALKQASTRCMKEAFTQAQAFAAIDQKIRSNAQSVLEEARRTKTLPRAAATSLALMKVRRAMRTRRWEMR